MLVAAAVLPHPPMLVPELAAGAADDVADLLARCRRAVGQVSAAADVAFVVGAEIGPRALSFAPWGVDVPVDVPEPLVLPLLVGGWLTAGRPRSFVSVAPDLPPDDCAELGAELAAAADRVTLLVLGDGAACHGEKSPGYADPRAAAYDADVAAALAAVDTARLLALDPQLAEELLVAGRAPWQVLAGAAVGAALSADQCHLSVPFGVGYHVAVWS